MTGVGGLLAWGFESDYWNKSLCRIYAAFAFGTIWGGKARIPEFAMDLFISTGY